MHAGAELSEVLGQWAGPQEELEREPGLLESLSPAVDRAAWQPWEESLRPPGAISRIQPPGGSRPHLRTSHYQLTFPSLGPQVSLGPAGRGVETLLLTCGLAHQEDSPDSTASSVLQSQRGWYEAGAPRPPLHCCHRLSELPAGPCLQPPAHGGPSFSFPPQEKDVSPTVCPRATI